MHSKDTLPQYIVNILWDIDLSSFVADLENSAEFLANRIAERGNTACLQWYTSKFGSQQFLNAISSNNRLNKYTTEFWQ